jgi:hypothetical protein
MKKLAFSFVQIRKPAMTATFDRFSTAWSEWRLSCEEMYTNTSIFVKSIHFYCSYLKNADIIVFPTLFFTISIERLMDRTLKVRSTFLFNNLPLVNNDGTTLNLFSLKRIFHHEDEMGPWVAGSPDEVGQFSFPRWGSWIHLSND